MSIESKSKRSYVRLSDEDWSTIRSEWESGDTTLADLSDRFGASIRSLLLHFEKHGSVKGSARHAQNLAAIRLAVPASSPGDASDPASVKSSALQHIHDIEEAVAGQLALIKADPSTAFRAGSAVKMLQAAADTVAKVYALKREILGLDRQNAQEPTVLVVRELFAEDIQRLRAEDDDDDIGDDRDLQPLDDEDNEIVVESPA